MQKLCWAICFFCLFHGQTYGDTNVLLLNSYHPQYRWTDELTRGVQESLLAEISRENLYIEYMDARRFIDDPVFNKQMTEILKYKYRHNKPDIVITSDDAAFQFMLDYGEQLFPEVPAVFSGVNVFKSSDIKHRDNITGIIEGVDIEGNIELIAALQPDIEKIIVLGDTRGFGRDLVSAAKAIKEGKKDWFVSQGIKLDIWDNFSFDELYQNASELPINSAILILAVHKDSNNEYFSYEAHVPTLSEKSTVPIYGMWGVPLIGHGAIGGMMNDPYEHGFNVGKLALKVLSGVPISRLPVQSEFELSGFKPRFDYHQLKRFGINLDQLPSNSIVHHLPISFYQKHRTFVNTIVVVFVVLTLLIAFLIWNIRRRILIQHELKAFNQKLDHTVKERTSELKQRNEELRLISESMKQLAHTDSLTGLNNRRAAEKSISAYIKRYSISDKPFGLVILDIDLFKRINDNFGHLVGDEVLQAIAKILQENIRPTDRVYRWGGEEFLIALPETGVDKAESILIRLADQIRNLRIKDVGAITVSMGVTAFEQSDNFETMVKRADDALYQAKESGRDKVMFA